MFRNFPKFLELYFCNQDTSEPRTNLRRHDTDPRRLHPAGRKFSTGRLRLRVTDARPEAGANFSCHRCSAGANFSPELVYHPVAAIGDVETPSPGDPNSVGPLQVLGLCVFPPWLPLSGREHSVSPRPRPPLSRVAAPHIVCTARAGCWMIRFPRRGSRPWRECNARARARTAVSKPTDSNAPKKNCCDKMTVTWTVYQLSH